MQDVVKYFRYAVLFPVIVSILILIFFVPILYANDYEIFYNNNNIYIVPNYVWPTPGYTYITSPFGKRTSPTKGASTYHQGIDIAAAEGSSVKAISSGTVTFAGWNSSGGYMVIIEHNDSFDSRYCHLGENLLVKKGENVYTGQIIATVGPKYVSSGKLNGATTGVHLHLGIRKNRKFVDPLQYLRCEK